MPLVDYERVVQQFEAELLTKRAWGQRDLLHLLATLRADNAIDEGQIDLALRRYSTELQERFFDRQPSATDREPQTSIDPRAARADVPGAPDHREARSAPEEEPPWSPASPTRPSHPSTLTSPRTSRPSAQASAAVT